MAGKGTKNNQQNTQGDAQTEQAVQTKPLDFDKSDRSHVVL